MGTRRRRLLALLIVATVVVKVVRALRGAPTRAFDRPRSPDRPPAPAPIVVVSTDTWVAPTDGMCPTSHAIKANLRSGIFHLPGMSAYERTNPDRCYADAESAVTDGLRVAKR